jgi:hypothetical protein
MSFQKVTRGLGPAHGHYEGNLIYRLSPEGFKIDSG